MDRTITGGICKTYEIEVSSMGVETHMGYNLDRPLCYDPETMDRKHASIFVGFLTVPHGCVFLSHRADIYVDLGVFLLSIKNIF
jgi:hypothetical protein